MGAQGESRILPLVEADAETTVVVQDAKVMAVLERRNRSAMGPGRAAFSRPGSKGLEASWSCAAAKRCYRRKGSMPLEPISRG